uniref:Uncharacterized protein n=1 Tax=Knipowitschia caucasica TaxID=637954 RepID=A0AAV2JLI5_KNICA
MTSSPRAHKQQPLRRATYWKYPRRESCGPGAEDGRHRAGSEINATKLSVEAEMTLPATPRLILLGNTFLSAMKWMAHVKTRQVQMNSSKLRINPEEGTKCSAKIGTSRKTGAEVKRKVETVKQQGVFLPVPAD